MTYRSLDRLDRKTLHLISEDTRIPFPEATRVRNVSGAAIHQRIQKLTNLGVLKGSQFIIDPERIGYETCAFIGLNLKSPEKLDDVVETLHQIPEIMECHYTTGEYDLFLKICAYDNRHLMSVVHNKLMPLDLSHSEGSIPYNAVIDRTLLIEGMEVAGVVLDDDEEDEE